MNFTIHIVDILIEQCWRKDFEV